MMNHLLGQVDAWGTKTVRGGRRLSKNAMEDRGISEEELKVIEEELTAQEVPKPAPQTEEPMEEEIVKEDNLMKKWDSQMSDFVPQQMYTMDILGKTDEVSL